MTQTRHEDLVTRYIDELNDALAGVPRSRRNELVDDIADHIDVLLAEAAEHRPVTRDVVEAVLAEVGDPAEIARAAGSETAPPQGMTKWDGATIGILLVGGLILPFVGWLIGVVMLWSSSAWRVKDKVIGTLFVPGGLLLPLLLVLVGGITSTSIETCTSGPGGVQHCTGGGPHSAEIIFLVILAYGLIGSIFGAVWLGRHARRSPAGMA
jgi:hypothetical protein